MSTPRGLEILKQIKSFLSTTNSFDKCLNKLNLLSGGNGKVVAEFTVGPEHLNRVGKLHGGFVAMIVDAVSTYAYRTHNLAENPGVSVDIQISYMSSAAEGDNIEIEAHTIKAGRSLAFLEVIVKNKDKQTIIAKGKHTKYVVSK